MLPACLPGSHAARLRVRALVGVRPASLLILSSRLPCRFGLPVTLINSSCSTCIAQLTSAPLLDMAAVPGARSASMLLPRCMSRAGHVTASTPVGPSWIHRPRRCILAYLRLCPRVPIALPAESQVSPRSDVCSPRGSIDPVGRERYVCGCPTRCQQFDPMCIGTNAKMAVVCAGAYTTTIACRPTHSTVAVSPHQIPR